MKKWTGSHENISSELKYHTYLQTIPNNDGESGRSKMHQCHKMNFCHHIAVCFNAFVNSHALASAANHHSIHTSIESERMSNCCQASKRISWRIRTHVGVARSTPFAPKKRVQKCRRLRHFVRQPLDSPANPEGWGRRARGTRGRTHVPQTHSWCM